MHIVNPCISIDVFSLYCFPDGQKTYIEHQLSWIYTANLMNEKKSLCSDAKLFLIH